MTETKRFSDLPVAQSMGDQDFVLGMAGGAPARVPMGLLHGGGSGTEDWLIDVKLTAMESGGTGPFPFEFIRPLPDNDHASLVDMQLLGGHEFKVRYSGADPLSVSMPGIGVGADICIDMMSLSESGVTQWGPSFTVPTIAAGQPTAAVSVCFKNQNGHWMDLFLSAMSGGTAANPVYVAGCGFVLQAGTDPYACMVGGQIIESSTGMLTMPQTPDVTKTITLKAGDRVYVGIRPGVLSGSGAASDATLVVAVNDVTQPTDIMPMRMRCVPVGEGLRPYLMLGVMGLQQSSYSDWVQGSFSPDELQDFPDLMAAQANHQTVSPHVAMAAFSVPAPTGFAAGKRYVVKAPPGGSVVVPFRGYMIREDDVVEVLDDGDLSITRLPGLPNSHLYALLDSAVLTGTPQAPTPPTADDSQRLATTHWVRQVLPVIPAPVLPGYATFGLMEDSSGSTTLAGDAVFFENLDGTALNSAVLYLPAEREAGAELVVRFTPAVATLTVRESTVAGDVTVATLTVEPGRALQFRTVALDANTLRWWWVV